MRGFVEGAAQIVESIAVADVQRTAPVESKIVEVLRDAEQSLPFDGVDGPSGNFGGELFKRGESALAAAEMDRVGYVGSRVEDAISRLGLAGSRWNRGSPAS